MTQSSSLFHFARCHVFVYSPSVAEYEALHACLAARNIPVQSHRIGTPRSDIVSMKQDNPYLRDHPFLLFVHSSLVTNMTRGLRRQYAQNDIRYQAYRDSADIFRFIDTNFDRSYTSDYLEIILRQRKNIDNIAIVGSDVNRENCLLRVKWADDSSERSYEFRICDVELHKRQLLESSKK